MLCKDTIRQDETHKKETAKRQRAKIEKALEKLQHQKEKLHTLLETDVYTVEVFLERSKIIQQQIEALEAELGAIQHEAEAQGLSPEQSLLWLQYVLDNFLGATPEQKNQMLRKVIRRIEYRKTQRMCYRKQDSDLSLHIDFL